LLIRAI
jgi:hypothetical protein